MKIRQVLLLLVVFNVTQFTYSSESSVPDSCEVNGDNWYGSYFKSYVEDKERFVVDLKACSINEGFSKEVDRLSVLSLRKTHTLDDLPTLIGFIKTTLLALAETGYAPSQHNYAVMHNAQYGSAIYYVAGVDYYTFLYWTKKAASLGEPRALYNLAERFQKDDLIPFLSKDLSTAGLIFKYLAERVENKTIDLPISHKKLISKYKILSPNIAKNAVLDLKKLDPNEEYRKPILLRGQFYFNDEKMFTRANMSMVLYRSDNSLEGYYFYDDSYKKWKSKFSLRGVIDGNRLNLSAFNEKGIKEEEFHGEYKEINDSIIIDAKWTRGSEKSGKVIFASDSFFDYHLTCDEMSYAGEIAFSAVRGDLGSGHNSNQKIDYECQDSLYTAPEFQKIYSIAADIRGGKKKTHCDGSIWYAKIRYSKNELLRASFSPYSYNNENRRPIEETLAYLEGWSKKELYNHELYESFLTELKLVEPRLQAYYQKNFSVDENTAKAYAKGAMSSFADYAGGSYSYGRYRENLTHNLTAAILENRPISEIKNLIDSSNGEDLPLHQAANNLEVTEFLLKDGSNVNSENYFGKTALYYAIQFNNLNVVKALVMNGASINHQYKSDKELYGDNDRACKYIEKTLRTPLMHAAQHSTPEVIAFLIENGADVSMKDEKGATALDYANDAKKEANILALKNNMVL